LVLVVDLQYLFVNFFFCILRLQWFVNCLSLLASAYCRKLWPYVHFVLIFSA